MYRIATYQLCLAIAAVLLFTGCDPAATPAKQQTQILHNNWEFRKAGDKTWMPAKVPGCVHLDLLDNGKIDDPFFGTNEKNQQWIEQEDWEYQTSFEVSKADLESQEFELQFDGLDTYGDVYLNDSLIFASNNMFRRWNKEVKRALKPGKNNLRVYFHSPMTVNEKRFKENGYELPAGNDQSNTRISVYTRKAPYHFGWDWGPRFVTSGIWRPVRLVTWNTARIQEIQIVQKQLSDSVATLQANIYIDAPSSGSGRIEIKCNDQLLAKDSVNWESNSSFTIVHFEIKNPKRWWPNGMGEPHLYPLEIELLSQNKAIDTKTENVGLRTIELRREKDKTGESFSFAVNGQHVFARGANIIPLDNFLPQVTHERYDKLIADALESNMNMLRVWGGGIYEDDYFYDLCDQNGIMVWQDFMFSCAMYPGDEEFLKSIAEEAEDNILRLRNHPSIALWCGNNEMEVAWFNWGWQNQFNYSAADSTRIWKDYQTIFDEILPQAVTAMDSERQYVPTSPISNWGKPENFTRGDMHYWGVWHGEHPLENYRDRVGRFMSEYGFQSLLSGASAEAFTNPEDRSLDAEVYSSRQRSPGGNERITRYMESYFKVPQSFEDFTYVSQLLQARAMEIAFEAHRNPFNNCAGTLYWQMNDCWPAASWSGIDYYGRWKPMQYKAKNMFASEVIIPSPKGDLLDIIILKDNGMFDNCFYHGMVCDLEGNVIDMDTSLIEEISGLVVEYDLPLLEKEVPLEEMVLWFAIRDFSGKVLHEKVVFPVEAKDQPLQGPAITTSIKEVNGELEIELSTDKLARYLKLYFEGEPGHFSDNYFDLVPGITKTVRYTGPIPENPAENLLIKNLFDTDPYQTI